MKLKNIEALHLINEINDIFFITKETKNLTALKYQLYKLLDEASKQLEPFEKVKSESIKNNTKENEVDVEAVEKDLNEIKNEEIEIKEKISLKYFELIETEKIYPILYKFITNE